MTNNNAQLYILISFANVADIGEKYAKNENSRPVFSPKSFLMRVYPNIPSITIGMAENSEVDYI